MNCSAHRILWLALALEGALGGIFFLWRPWRGENVALLGPPGDLLYGAAAALPLLALNAALLRWRAPVARIASELEEFKREVLWPLASLLDTRRALVVSLLAGTGEELFFRGVLQNEFGIALSSVLFAALHFGMAIRRFPVVTLIYFLVSAYIGLVYAWCGTLLAPIALHTLYDFAALHYLRRSVDRDSPIASS